MAKLSIRDIELKNKHVFIRVDFNVPLSEDGRDHRRHPHRATLPTIEYALRHHAKVILASHLGRPKGKPNPKYSAAPCGRPAARTAGQKDWRIHQRGLSRRTASARLPKSLARQLESRQVLLLENLRFHAEEEANDPASSKQLASLCEIYVNDAFGSAHRAHASTEGITHFLKPAVAGLLMEKEITYLGKALEAPEKPFVAIIGGSKDFRQDRRDRQPAR